MEESKEPEKQESKVVEEEEPARVEEDREVSLRLHVGRLLCDAPPVAPLKPAAFISCQEEERKRLEEVERQRRERRYILPDEPTILVHPNWAAKNGKFDCSVMSLSVLLDYRLEDNKEHSFEVGGQSRIQSRSAASVPFGSTFFFFFVLQVSLFAELFNEMLQRDFGFRIYKALAAIPVKDDKKDKEKKVKKESEKRDAKKEKDEDGDELPVKKAKEDEDDKKKVSLTLLFINPQLVWRN